MKVSDKDYYNGKDCEFRADGKLRGGKVINELMGKYLIAYHCPHYREIVLPRDKVKVWSEKLNCHV